MWLTKHIITSTCSTTQPHTEVEANFHASLNSVPDVGEKFALLFNSFNLLGPEFFLILAHPVCKM
jgi:hypothetical protein